MKVDTDIIYSIKRTGYDTSDDVCRDIYNIEMRRDS